MKDFLLERYFARHEFSARFMLSSSDCDGLPMEQLISLADSSELTLWKGLRLGYTESPGSIFLREKISALYSAISPDDTVVASPGELNYITMNLLTGPGDHAVVVSPSYQSLYEVIRSTGCDVSFWRPEEGTWKFDIDALEALIRPQTKLIVINFPHNPTGAYISVKELTKIVDIARRAGAWLFSDEMYRSLLIEENLEELPAVCDIYEKGISLWGMAKSFALAGLRIGWIACRDRQFLQRVLSFKDYLSICSSAPSEVLAAIALGHKEKLISDNISKIKSNLHIFSRFAAGSAIFGNFTPPRAGSVAFVPVNCAGTSLQFSDSLVERTGIMTVPAEMFEYPGRYLRIGFGRNGLEKELKALK